MKAIGIEFTSEEQAIIDNYKNLINFDELLNVLDDDKLYNKGDFQKLNEYLCSLDLVEFKPSLNSKEGQLKFTQSVRIMTVDAFKKEVDRLKGKYQAFDEEFYNQMMEDGDYDGTQISKLYQFLYYDAADVLQRAGIYSDSEWVQNKRKAVYADFDGCDSPYLKETAVPVVKDNEQWIKSEIIDAIFKRCLKLDDENEWARTACEYFVREELGVWSADTNGTLRKLTDNRRYGIDETKSQKVILYSDMVEEKTSKHGVEYWRIYLPKYKDADKAWINVKRDAIVDVDEKEDIVNAFLTKNVKYNVHFIKDGKLESEWALSNKDVIPLLKEVTDEYLQWLEDATNPTFAKKLSALNVGKEKEDFVLAINEGKSYIAIHFIEDKVEGKLYDGKFTLDGEHKVVLGEDILDSVGEIFDYLSPTNAKKSSLGVCDMDIFKSKVEENKIASDYKMIANVDEMSSTDDKRGDLAKVMAKKDP